MDTTDHPQPATKAPADAPDPNQASPEEKHPGETSPIIKLLVALDPLFTAIGYVFKGFHWFLSLFFSDKMMKAIDGFFSKILDAIIGDETVGIITGMVLMAIVVWSAPDPLRDLGTLKWCRQVQNIDAHKIARHYRIKIELASKFKGNCLRYQFEGKMDVQNTKALEIDTEKSAEDVLYDEKTREFEKQRKEEIKQKALNPAIDRTKTEEDTVNPDDFIDF